MFEKIKEKAAKGKEWAINHKTDLAYLGGCVVGSVITYAVYTHDDKKRLERSRERYPKEIGVLSMQKYADARYWLYGSTNKGPTAGELSDYMKADGMPEDEKVIGALVYTKKQ